MSKLAAQDVIPPRGGEASPITGSEAEDLLSKLGGDWVIAEEKILEKEYRFSNFQAALEFTNRVGHLAEEVDHHPEICLTWGKARVTIWTHSIGGLSEADFVFAAKCDQLYS